MEFIEAILSAWEKIKKAIKKYWSEFLLFLLKSKSGRQILMKIVKNNNWRKNHGIPMIRRKALLVYQRR